MRIRSYSDVECRLGHDACSYRCVKVYFCRFRYSFRRMSKRLISQARMASPRVFISVRQQMPMGRRLRNHLFARRAALLKTTTELLPELTCKVEHRIIPHNQIWRVHQQPAYASATLFKFRLTFNLHKTPSETH